VRLGKVDRQKINRIRKRLRLQMAQATCHEQCERDEILDECDFHNT